MNAIREIKNAISAKKAMKKTESEERNEKLCHIQLRKTPV